MKKKIALAIIALITAYAFGRYSAPEKIKIETKIVEVEKKTEKRDVDKQNHKKTTTVTEIKPDGSKTITTVITDEGVTKTKDRSITDSTRLSQETKEITNSSSKVTISGLAGLNPFRMESGIDLGASVSRPILGPLTVGIFGFKSGMCGVSAGLTF